MTLRRSQWALACASILVSLTIAEAAARVSWRMKYVAFHPSRILYTFYPELRLVADARPRHNDAFYDILLLGGSTLHPAWGRVEAELRSQIASQERRDVRIFNLATPGHSSRDSLLKYEALGDARFEMVLVYNGLNEVRANNVPPDLFKDDYSHYVWYETANRLAPYHGRAWFALPYTVATLPGRIRQTLAPDRYVPPFPRPEWLHYGRDVRSAGPFARNLESIATRAAARGDRLIVMTFATYLRDAGRDRSVETWGEPAKVMAAVARHNDAVRALARRRPEVWFVDQANLLAGSEKYFEDICHLTPAGSAYFVRNLIERWPWPSQDRAR